MESCGLNSFQSRPSIKDPPVVTNPTSLLLEQQQKCVPSKGFLSKIAVGAIKKRCYKSVSVPGALYLPSNFSLTNVMRISSGPLIVCSSLGLLPVLENQLIISGSVSLWWQILQPTAVSAVYPPTHKNTGKLGQEEFTECVCVF